MWHFSTLSPKYFLLFLILRIMLIMWFFAYKSLPNLLFGVLCLPGDRSHPVAQPTINRSLACCICWARSLGHAVFPPWNKGPNSGSYNGRGLLSHLIAKVPLLFSLVGWFLLIHMEHKYLRILFPKTSIYTPSSRLFFHESYNCALIIPPNHWPHFMN